jgi:hypothetical protein
VRPRGPGNEDGLPNDKKGKALGTRLLPNQTLDLRLFVIGMKENIKKCHSISL